MRASRTIEVILEILQAQAEATADILDAMTSGYYESGRKLRRSAKYGPRHFRENWAETFRNRQKFYNLLNHLKTQGLIENKKGGGQSRWRITAKGLDGLGILKSRNLYAKASAVYKSEADTATKIIAYDIPAKETRKRHWLRFALQSLGFHMLQKSVWIGKKKIPEEFLNALRERKMLGYVHIFAIAKSGTLREIA